MPRFSHPAVSAVAAAGLTLAIAGCGPTAYKPASSSADTGYQTAQLSEGRYRVSFEGNPDTERETVETYLLYRAAEVAAETGHPYFAIVEGDTAREVDVRRYRTVPDFYGYGPGLGYERGFPGFPYRTTMAYGAAPRTRIVDSYSAVATVEMLQERPRDREQVFETQQVLTTLRPNIEQSGEG